MYIDIKSRRKELGLTLEDVGKLVGVSKSTVKKWENGFIKNMRRDKILLLANAIQVSPLDILSLSESSKKHKNISISGEFPITKEYSSALADFFGKVCDKNTLILNTNNSAVCYTLSPDALNKIKTIIELDNI